MNSHSCAVGSNHSTFSILISRHIKFFSYLPYFDGTGFHSKIKLLSCRERILSNRRKKIQRRMIVSCFVIYSIFLCFGVLVANQLYQIFCLSCMPQVQKTAEFACMV